MAETDFEKYLVRRPLLEMGKKAAIKGRQLPTMTYMSNALVPGSNTYIEYGWIWEMPDPNPHLREHAHEFDEIVLHLGSDPERPEDLGAELEFFVNGQSLVFGATTALFVPAGVRHTPIVWKNVTRPHIEMSITLGNGNYGYQRRAPAENQAPSRRTEGVDFEKYLVRKPITRAEVEETIQDRQLPAIYMSNRLVPGSNTSIELSWISGNSEPKAQVREHTHAFTEIMLYIGSDSQNPEVLGGEVEFLVAGQSLVFDTNAAIFLPAGISHAHVASRRVAKPHMMMSILLG